MTSPTAAPPLRVDWEADLGDHIVRAVWSPDGSKIAAACIQGSIAVFDRHGRLLYELPGHAPGTLCVDWSPDGLQLASGGLEPVVRLWDAASGQVRAELEAGMNWVEQVRYAPHGGMLATACGRELRLWTSAGALVRTYDPHPSTIADLQWQPGELFLATASYGQLATFRPDAEEPVKRFSWKGSILTIAWSPDSNFVATGNQDASVHFWYRKTGKDLEMTGYPAKVRELSWDATSRYLATGGSPIVIIWDCSGKGPAGSKPIQLDGHDERPIRALAFQHHGKFLASGGQEGRVCLWQPQRHARLIRQSELSGSITHLDWAPDDRHLAAASSRGLLRVFRPAED